MENISRVQLLNFPNITSSKSDIESQYWNSFEAKKKKKI